MKLCIVTHRVMIGDGQGRVNYEVAWEALRRGHCITLLASQIAPELEQHSQVSWVPIAVKKVPTQLLQDLAFSIQSGNWLKQHRSQFDVVKVNGCITQAPADISAVHFVHSSWLRSPVHIWQQQQNLYSAYQWLYTTLNARWEKAAFHQAKVVVAVSEKIKQELIEIGISEKRVVVIVNGVDIEEFHPAPTDRATLGLPDSVPLALFVGDIRSLRKNLDTVLKALVDVPQLYLVVVGDTEKSPYPAMAERLDVQTRVHFMGYRRDVAHIMQAVDLFVFPSRYEACSLVLLEALASGLPVITAMSTGGVEIITPDCGIVLSHPDDTPALVNALHQLTADPHKRQKMGHSARQTAEGHTWTQMASRYLEVFEELSRC